MAVQPVVYGNSHRPPRGDYERANADYTCTQDWAQYTEQDHDTFRRLYQQQLSRLPGLACDAFLAALPSMELGRGIPRFGDINQRLRQASGWEIVAVPGLIPELAFFELLARRRFPVTDWIRTPAEFDYIVEPDVFHDLFGHVPMLFNPVFADYVQRYGEGGLKAHALGAGELLARLYWYTIEFGLIRQADGIRAYGAGLLSSPAELAHSVQSPSARRIGLDLVRCMRTRYTIDSFQATYFVIDSLDQLIDMTAPDFAPLYELVRSAGDLSADAIQASDVEITSGK